LYDSTVYDDDGGKQWAMERKKESERKVGEEKAPEKKLILMWC
jgi:hypothetical protein